MPLAIIAEIGSRRRIVGPVSPRAVRHGLIVARGRCGDGAVVIISIRVIVVWAVVVIAIGRPDADSDRNARPEAAAAVVMAIAAAVIAAAGITTARITIPHAAAAHDGCAAGTGSGTESRRRGLPESGSCAAH